MSRILYNINLNSILSTAAILFSLTSPKAIEMEFLLLNMARALACLFTFFSPCVFSRCVCSKLAKRSSYISVFLLQMNRAGTGSRCEKNGTGSRRCIVVSCGYKNKLLTVFFLLLVCFDIIFFFLFVWNLKPDRDFSTFNTWY